MKINFFYLGNAIPLAVSAIAAEGDILELGLGMFSTPILHKIAYDKNVEFYSVETDEKWAAKFKHYALTKSHYVNVSFSNFYFCIFAFFNPII